MVSTVRRFLVALTVVLVSIPVGVMASVWWASSRADIDVRVEDLAIADAEAAALSSRALVDSAAASVAFTAGFERWRPGTDDALVAMFHEILDTHPEFSGIFVGESDGSFVFVNRDGVLLRTKTIVTVPERSVELEWRDSTGTVVRRDVDPDDQYDPRMRPWYTVASASSEVAFTPPYIFFTAREPGITAAAAYRRADGSVRGVAGVDISVADLSQFLGGLETTRRSQALIVDADGAVIAHSDPTKLLRQAEDGSLQLTRVAELEDPVGRAGVAAIIAGGGTPDQAAAIRFDVEGVSYLGAFAPIGGDGPDWTVVVLAPEADFLGLIDRRGVRSMAAAILGTVAAALIGIFAARRITGPMERMRAEAQRILEGEDLGESVKPSGLSEIDATSHALRSTYAELDRRVEERTSELALEVAQRRKAQAEAAAASDAKSRLIRTVSHELRTPLTAVVGYADLLATELSPDHFGYPHVADISTSASHMLALINDMLDLARIESGRLELHESSVDLADVIAEAVRMVRPRADSDSIGIEVRVDGTVPHVLGDERRLRQVLLNLVSNAVKYTQAGGHVGIDSRIESDGSLRITVCDNGPGMTPDQIAVALSPFGTVAETHRSGSVAVGLGLNVTRELLHAHGGTLSLESRPGHGTTAMVTIPAERVLGRSHDRIDL